MQILASALPGFRDLRAPLTAGYLWLILLWIWLKPDLAVRPTNEISAAVYDLGTAVGPIWVALAVSLTAYLVGAVSQIFSSTLSRAVKFTWDGIDRGLNWLRKWKRFRWIPLMSISKPPSPLARYWEGAVEGVRFANRSNDDDRSNAELADHAESFIAFLAEEAGPRIERDVSLPSALLLAKESLLFTETDRLKAEKQFRLAIIPPLATIAVFLSLNGSNLWLLSFFPLSILLWQSHIRQLEYTQLMYGALERRIIESDSVEMFRRMAEPEPPKS